MLPRDRVLAALDFRPVDVVPLRVFPGPGGLYEHGQKLLDLIRDVGHDFGDFDSVTLPSPPGPEDLDPDGRYHARRTDEWGTTWQYRIFGVWGRVLDYPLADMSKLDKYRFPDPSRVDGPDFEAVLGDAQRLRGRFFQLEYGGSIFEKMNSLRPWDDVVVDVLQDTPGINRLADRLVDYWLNLVRRAIALGADGVSFGDDFGTQQAPIFPPAVWRRFFLDRYRRLFAPAHQASIRIFFHTCGQVTPLLEDFAELGVSVLWPQLPLWEPADLAHRCRKLGLAVELHPDRGDLMQLASPGQVRDYLLRVVEEFQTRSGGSILYLEVDPNFPWKNVEALFETAQELRSSA